MKRRFGILNAAAIAGSLGAFLTGTVLASMSVQPEPGDQLVQGAMIARPAPEPPSESAATRFNERIIEIAGSNREVHLWDQTARDGSTRPHYAIMERLSGDAEASIVGRERETSYNIGLRYASFNPLVATPGVNAQLLAPANNEIFLVQFWAVPLDEMRDQIEAMGGKIHRYLEDHTHIVQMPAGVAQSVRRLNYVRWVGPFHAAYKLDESIISAFVNGFPNGGIAGAQEGLGDWFTTGEYSIEVFERAGGKPVIERRIEASDAGGFEPAPERPARRGLGQQAVVKAAIEAMGGSVSVVTPGGFRMQAHLTPQQLIQVARLNEVHFIDPWGFGGTDTNLVRLLGGANALESATGMSGEGVRAEVFDTELRTTHQEFAGVNNLILHGGINPGSAHGTSVFSIMFAQGVSGNARGLLPDAERSYFYHGANATQFGGPQTRMSIASQSVTNNVVIQTSSLGNPRTLLYGTISAEMDDVIFDTQLLHTQSQSNAGGTGIPRNSRPQAWSKNIVSGGAVHHQNTSGRSDDTFLGPFGGGSIGPAADSRIKPDLSFFYDSTFAASNGSNTSYTQFGGTSGATPSVGGYMGLFHQMWHENTWQGSGRLDNVGGGHTVFSDRPNAMLPKVALINSAFRYDWNSGGPNASITRFVQGWGMPRVDALRNLRNKTYYADEPFLLRQGASKSVTIMVQQGEPNLNVSMAYLDPMGTTSATTHRINDLSLRVTSPGGTSFWGNNGLTADNTSTSGGSSNTKDTVENVFIPNPEAGAWTVEVIADVVVQDAHVETGVNDTDYALWVTGGTESGSIKTTFRAGNGLDGAMFDITAHEDINITGFDVHHTATTSVTIEVYAVAGGFAGHETDPTAWTMLGSQTLTPNGGGAATHVDIGCLVIPAGGTFGLYVTDTSGAGLMSYTNGGETWDNGEVAISAGVGKGYPFAATFSPRSFNGVIYYDTSTSSTTATYPTTGHVTSNFIPLASGTTTMHQVFDSTLFSGNLGGGASARITTLALSPGVTGLFNLGAVDINLGYTNAAPGGLALPSAGTNPNGPMTSFFSDPSYSVNVTASGSEAWSEVVFAGSFDYDPALGNLLVEFIVPNAGNTTLHVSRAANSAESSRTYDTSRFGNSAANTTATRMQFTYAPVGPYVFPTTAHAASNFVPFGSGSTTMHQVIPACLFAARLNGEPVANITDIAFSPGITGNFNLGPVSINLGYTNAAPGGLALPSAGTNPSAPLTGFFSSRNYSVNVTAAGPDEWSEMVFSGSFDYDPSLGNLLVEIVASNTANASLHVSRTEGSGEGSRTYDTTRFGNSASNTTATRMQFNFNSANACPCACNMDTSTGLGVCDLFDFLAFQGGFVAGETCQCDIDVSTGVGVCDLFDFLAFQGAFVAGCP